MLSLFTDFGPAGPYVGQVRAVLAASGMTQPVIELISDAPAFDPVLSSYFLAALSRQMPADTLFLAVVDPGVGGERMPVILRTRRHWYVGPDNGLFREVVRDEGLVSLQTIDPGERPLSSSFHGRDLFAPAAASLCLGDRVPGDGLGRLSCWDDSAPASLFKVIYTDHYGNAFTGIQGESLDRGARLLAGGETLAYARTFSEAEPGTPFWYVNSCGLIEISVNQGRADQRLSLLPGTEVRLASA
jgi:S-adenosylmethionine hydrolase